MISKKLFKKLGLFFSRKKFEAQQQRLELQTTLKQLKAKQKSLKAELEDNSNDEERQQLAEKITILETQRRKGIEKLRNPNEIGRASCRERV